MVVALEARATVVTVKARTTVVTVKARAAVVTVEARTTVLAVEARTAVVTVKARTTVVTALIARVARRVAREVAAIPPALEATLPPILEPTLPPILEPTLPPALEAAIPPALEATLGPATVIVTSATPLPTGARRAALVDDAEPSGLVPSLPTSAGAVVTPAVGELLAAPLGTVARRDVVGLGAAASTRGVTAGSALLRGPALLGGTVCVMGLGTACHGGDLT